MNNLSLAERAAQYRNASFNLWIKLTAAAIGVAVLVILICHALQLVRFIDYNKQLHHLETPKAGAYTPTSP